MALGAQLGLGVLRIGNGSNGTFPGSFVGRCEEVGAREE